MTPEYTWSRLPRGGWEIRRRGDLYLTITPDEPAHTETYVTRWVRRLNERNT